MKASRHKYRGYSAFTAMCELHAALFPNETAIDGNSRKAHMIYRAFDKVYTDGIEEAIFWDEDKRKKECRKVGAKERDI